LTTNLHVLQTVASKLHGTEVEVTVVQGKDGMKTDHVQFMITTADKNKDGMDEMMISSDAATVTNIPLLSQGKKLYLLKLLLYIFCHPILAEVSLPKCALNMESLSICADIVLFSCKVRHTGA